VVTELVNNSWAHVEDGPQRDWVSVSIDDGGDFLRINVTDPGGGTEPCVVKLKGSAKGRQESGRGMRIVQVLSRGHWTTYVTDEGHRVVQVVVHYPAASREQDRT
jgi:anti-sigma regulatory factor (Ser/Thr protein kinase)